MREDNTQLAGLSRQLAVGSRQSAVHGRQFSVGSWLCVLVLGFSMNLVAQEKVSLDGYVSDMQTAYILDGDNYIWENLAHRRLNFNYYPNEWMKISIQERTRFIQGNTISKFPGYSDMIGQDAGWADLTFAQGDMYNNSVGYIYTTMIDRANVEFTFGNFVGTIGRQRINWGQTFAWNPNDIFNSYSYFDVDYPERPGSDAMRLQYYTSMTSSIEVAVKVDSSNKITAASYYRFNVGSYDIQVLGGVVSEKDLVVGTGWSGNIRGSSFRGEMSYFKELEHLKDTSGYFLVSVGMDHTFDNSLWIQGEVLFSQFAKDRKLNNILEIFGSDMNIKNIGFTEWSVFGSISYSLTPLINTSLSGIYFPEWKGFYIGPNIDISVSNNVSASIILQAFSIELEDFSGNTERQNTYIGYGKLKWSF